MPEFTGYRDSNGKKIYDGDLVAVYGPRPLIVRRFKGSEWWVFEVFPSQLSPALPLGNAHKYSGRIEVLDGYVDYARR